MSEMSDGVLAEGVSRYPASLKFLKLVAPLALVVGCGVADANSVENGVVDARVELTQWQEDHLYEGEGCSGDRVVYGTIQGEDDQPVPAQIGLDFSDADGVNIDYDGTTKDGPYSDVLLLNLLDVPDADQTTWCANVPEQAINVSVEAYSRRVFDENGNLANSSDEYGHTMDHHIALNAGNTRVDLVLPQVCGYGDQNVANTGSINISSVVNGEPTPPWRTIAWSRRSESDDTIPGFAAANIEQPHTNQAREIGRLEPNQEYLLKTHILSGGQQNNEQYVVNIDDVSVDPCQTTQMSIEITDVNGAVSCRAQNGISQQDCTIEKQPYEPLN